MTTRQMHAFMSRAGYRGIASISSSSWSCWFSIAFITGLTLASPSSFLDMVQVRAYGSWKDSRELRRARKRGQRERLD